MERTQVLFRGGFFDLPVRDVDIGAGPSTCRFVPRTSGAPEGFLRVIPAVGCSRPPREVHLAAGQAGIPA
ncbi:MAG: hypothetical protein L0K27_12640, partial [Corynebacterium nuruki]|nr:hypothetical protein [Corynebacterium nuruki]